MRTAECGIRNSECGPPSASAFSILDCRFASVGGPQDAVCARGPHAVTMQSDCRGRLDRKRWAAPAFFAAKKAEATPYTTDGEPIRAIMPPNRRITPWRNYSFVGACLHPNESADRVQARSYRGTPEFVLYQSAKRYHCMVTASVLRLSLPGSWSAKRFSPAPSIPIKSPRRILRSRSAPVRPEAQRRPFSRVPRVEGRGPDHRARPRKHACSPADHWRFGSRHSTLVCIITAHSSRFS